MGQLGGACTALRRATLVALLNQKSFKNRPKWFYFASQNHQNRILEASKGMLGASWGILGCLFGFFSVLWSILEPSWCQHGLSLAPKTEPTWLHDRFLVCVGAS